MYVLRSKSVKQSTATYLVLLADSTADEMSLITGLAVEPRYLARGLPL